MATAESVAAAIAAKLQTTLPNTPARMGSDLDSTLQRVPAGTVRYQLQAYAGPPTTVEDSAVTFKVGMAVRLRVHYHLSLGQAETEWTQTQVGMLGAISALTDPDWWRTVAGVFFVDELPEVALGDVTRTGRVVTFELTVQLTVDPD